MEYVKDFEWKHGITTYEIVDQFKSLGFQSIELAKAGEIIYKMKKEKVKIILTFTSNLGTSGLRGLFAQLIKLGMVDVLVTTAGAIEEDIMKAIGEKFLISRFDADDIELHEKGMNRVGNIIITNDSYVRFEGFMRRLLEEITKEKKQLSGFELFKIIGSKLNDEKSFLYQAYKHNVPVYCPAITDGSIGFQLFLAKQDYKDFIVDVVEDFRDITIRMSYDEKKGLIALGGGTSKHYALLSALISGGFDYAVYITTSLHTSGSMSGATTKEAKSWGKVKDDSDSITVIGDATILFPLAASYALEKLYNEGLIKI
ncbi:MAG: deoxyhypusine synthase family protein [Candidatus Aenigmatarchaeota archaeon]